MEPVFDKIVLQAPDFTGGSGHMTFQAHERFNDRPGLANGQSSDARPAVALAGAPGPGAPATCRFRVPSGFFATPLSHRQHELWITGMWDHYRFLAAEWDNLHSHMATCGHFRIAINDAVVFDSQVFFWNCRQWRFWPCFEVAVPETVFQPGMNTLTFQNFTKPFGRDFPGELRNFLPNRSEEPPREITENTTFHLATVQVATRHLDDFLVLNAPRVVRVGQPFMVEVYATADHELDHPRDSPVQWLSPPRLSPGRNPLRFRIDAPTGPFAVTGTAAGGERFSVTIDQAVAVDAAGDFLCGHIVGNFSAFPLDHDYGRAVELFRDTGQGNLVAWLASPAKAGEYITADCIPIEDIRRSGLKVLFRYYGGFAADSTYPSEVARCMHELGDAFVGLAPHEQGSCMIWAMDGAATRREASARFAERTRRMLAEIKQLAGERLVWVTDPSLYANTYRRHGADRVGLELFPLQCNLNIASVRGTARMYGDPGWAAINSFECQAYGGLDMPEPMQQLDPRYDEKRLNLWWFSQFHLYLAGARTLYSESGVFEQVVTRHLHMDDPRLVRWRDVQRDLVAFSNLHPLPQPEADFAFVKDEGDIFTDIYAPSSEDTRPSDFSWTRARVAWPQLRWGNEHLRSLAGAAGGRRYYSDTPFGEVDLVTDHATPDALAPYRAVALVGDHALSGDAAGRLARYVESGGHVILSLVDFLDQALNPAAPDTLETLTGLALAAPVEKAFLWQIETVDPAFVSDFAAFEIPCALGKGAYDGLVLGHLELTSAHRVIIRDRFTHTPFLVACPRGRGTVWLVNSVHHHHGDRDYYLLVNRIVETVFQRMAGPVRLLNGAGINHFVYARGSAEAPWRQLMALNNDWYSPKERRTARFAYGDLTFDLSVPRRRVMQCFLLPDMVLIPDSRGLRLDGITNVANGLHLDLQGAKPIEATLVTKSRIAGAALFNSNGQRTDMPLTGGTGATRLHLPLAGKHRLEIHFS